MRGRQQGLFDVVGKRGAILSTMAKESSQSMKWTEEHEGMDAYATMAAQERHQ